MALNLPEHCRKSNKSGSSGIGFSAFIVPGLGTKAGTLTVVAASAGAT